MTRITTSHNVSHRKNIKCVFLLFYYGDKKVVYVNVDFEGVPKEILDAGIRRGYAKTKAGLLRLALLAFNDKYSIIEAQEDIENARDVQRVDASVASGKGRWLSSADFAKRTGVRR